MTESVCSHPIRPHPGPQLAYWAFRGSHRGGHVPPLLLADHPASQDAALWRGLENLSVRLVSLLGHGLDHWRAPLLISGSWGAGKTSLLKSMERKLNVVQRAASATIWFDAWRYEGEGALLPALVRTVWEALPQQVRDQAEHKAAFAVAGQAALQMGARAVPAVAAALGFGLVAGLSKVALDAANSTGPARAPAPIDDPSRVLVHKLKGLIEAGWPADDPATRHGPIVFIDDLDRCSPDGALALLDQVRAVLAAAETDHLRVRFVMAMDRDVLLSAVASKYRNLARYDANRFLEKMFPLAFSVPTPNTAEAGRLVEQFAGDDLPQHQVQALTAALSPRFFANPRLMKRCVNRFRLVAWFESSTESAWAKDPADSTYSPTERDADYTLAKWIAAGERWTGLRRMRSDFDDEYWACVGDALANDTELPGPDAAALLKHRGMREWLTKVFKDDTLAPAKLQEAELRLQRWGL